MFKKSVPWSDIFLGLTGLALIYLLPVWLLAALFVGMDEPYQNAEAVLTDLHSEFARLANPSDWMNLIPSLYICLAVSVLWLAHHPRPWRAPARAVLLMTIPLVIWSACWIVSQIDGRIGLRDPPPQWLSSPIFSILGYPGILALLLLVTVVICVLQWLREGGLKFQVKVTRKSLRQLYHGE